MKKTKRIISSILWALVGLYVVFVVLLHVPTVQRYLGSQAAQMISEKLGTSVQVGRVNLGFLNRIIIDDVQIQDQQHQPMLNAARVSAKFDLLPLTHGRMIITSAQLFGLRAVLYQDQPDSNFNFQFVLDSLASKDSTSHTPLDLKINSLIIRRGQVSFDKKYIATEQGRFSPSHIHASDISAHMMLNALQDDSLNLNVKRLSLKEASGFQVKNLKCKATMNRQQADLRDLCLEFPESELTIKHLSATYQHEKGRFAPSSLQYNGSIIFLNVTLSDLSAFVPSLKNNSNQVSSSFSFIGDNSHIRVENLKVHASDGSLNLLADALLSDWQNGLQWNTDIDQLHITPDAIQTILSCLPTPVKIPEEVTRLGSVDFIGALGKSHMEFSVKGLLTTDAGQAQLALNKKGRQFTGSLTSNGLNLRKILNDDKLGQLVADLGIDGQWTDTNHLSFKTKGYIARLDFNNYSYSNIDVSGTYINGTIDGQLAIDDPNAKLNIWGIVGMNPSSRTANITADIQHLKPSALKLTDQWGDAVFNFNLTTELSGHQLNTANGDVNIGQFQMTTEVDTFSFDNLHLSTTYREGKHHINMESDFGEIDIEGQYDYNTLPQSIANLIGSKLPTLPGLPKKSLNNKNNFTLNASISDGNWLRKMFNIPLTLYSPMQMEGQMNDDEHELNLDVKAPHFTYDDTEYRDGILKVSSPNDTLKTFATLRRIVDNGNELILSIQADAADNHLKSVLDFENHARHPMKGRLNADTQFFRTDDGLDAAHVDIHTSEFTIGQTIWQVEPGTIVYCKEDLTVDHLAVKSGNQHLIVDGHATASANDSLVADLRNIDVDYILDLVNFHSVKLSGMASGTAVLRKAFEQPEAVADITVEQFRFQSGKLGTLTAHAQLNNDTKQIDIQGVTNDTILPNPLHPTVGALLPSYLTVNGYVSPWRNDIELFISPRNARGEFLESFCGSFMRDVNVQLTGDLRLYGPLNNVNLTGQAVADGTIGIKPLNTTYTLRNDTIRLIPDEIIFERDTVYDVNEHIAIVDGALHHKSLKDLTYDIGIKAQNLLAFDVREFGNDTFCGTVYGTGSCNINGRRGEVNIDIDVTPDENSEIRYNASSPDAISNGEFIEWNDREQALIPTTPPPSHYGKSTHIDKNDDIPADIHMNFLINATPSSTLKVIMDQSTGDYIALNGNGVIHAAYYNKGTFDMFGNLNVDHGVYKLTIQNVIKKDFQFQQGSSISFGGDPFGASLNLKALYTVAGVPLSDLNMGRSFTSNNIRVNCLMNIGGTVGQPRVEFDLDMPTVGTDAKQMIFSLINSEEEMNQQVLYLLAVGRFYNQGANNANESAGQQSQTSLAMQSLLSGTISQQLNSVLSNIVKNQNWNFGANISTGDQGFYNAEYEGLLSGRLLDNRLLINGEFGYRDNPNATTSFIGDFDLRYLLRPTGNLAVKVYNQTNDRYFTRNSLNTQGVGLIMKKDFDGLRDLFGIKKKPAANKTDEPVAIKETQEEEQNNEKSNE